MKSFDMTDGSGIDLADFGVIKASELVYLRYSKLEVVVSRDLSLIASLAQQTSNLFISIPSEELKDIETMGLLYSKGVRGVSLRYSYDSKKWLNQVGFGQSHSGDRDVIESFSRSLSAKPSLLELTAELILNDDSRVLGATIAGLHLVGCPWVVLDVPNKPEPVIVRKLAEVFEYLKIRNLTKLNVYFPFWHESNEEWNIKTQNTFSGLREIHIDISNRCTHSCVFCGLYAPESLKIYKEANEGRIPKVITDHMNKEISYERALEFIQTLPWTVKQIQFGGLGDPLMHKHAIDLIRTARERGFYVEVLSNMDYLNDEDINLLHSLGGPSFYDLHFIANVSGGDVATYVATRPKQTEKNYENVKKTLKKLSDLRTEGNGVGVNFTIMCVVNKYNCHSLKSIARFALEVGARAVWFKPMEVHGDYHKKVIPEREQLIEMASSLEDAIKLCDRSQINVFEREYSLEIINSYRELADVR